MPKQGSQDDNIFGDTVVVEKEKEKPRREREPRRVPYEEPSEAQEDGHEEVVQTPDGKLSFLAVRMNKDEFRKAGFKERKRLKLMYSVREIYAGAARPYYSYDELEQLRKGELKR